MQLILGTTDLQKALMLYLRTLGIQVTDPATDVQLQFDEATESVRVLVEVASIQPQPMVPEVAPNAGFMAAPASGALGETVPVTDVSESTMRALVAQGTGLAFTTTRNTTAFIQPLTGMDDGDADNG